MKVNALIIGAARSATTSISQILDQHPEICLSNPKEPQFFSNPNWRDHIDTYHQGFEKEATIYLEASTNYSKFPAFNPKIHQDISEYNKDIKLIYIMRHPIDRMVSHYKFSVERGLTTDDLETAFQTNPIYKDTSDYYKQIELYLKYFKKEQLLLLLFEDFSSNPVKVLNEISKFLDVSPFEFDLSKSHVNRSNSGEIGHIKYDKTPTLQSKIKKVLHYLSRQWKPAKTKIELSSELKKEIQKDLENDLVKLESLLNRDLSQWRQ